MTKRIRKAQKPKLKIVPKQSMAVPHWSELIAKGKAPLPPISQIPGYSKEAEEEGWELFSTFIFATPQGNRPFVESCPKWMEQVARWIFGTEDPKTGHRLVNEICLTISKKNGKTTLFSLILLAMWIKSNRHDAEALIMAPTKEAAIIAFNTVRNAIIHTEFYKDMFRFIPTHKKIVSKDDEKVMRIVAADTDALTGIQAAYIYIDELHQIAKSANARELIPHIRGAKRARKDAITFVTSTHAHKIGNDVWESMVKRGREIRDGKGAPGTGKRAYISYEWTQKELDTKAYEDPKLWHKTNPSIDTVILDRNEMLGEAEDEKGDPKDWSDYCNQFLNVEPGVWRGDASWEGSLYWDACKFEPIAKSGLDGIHALFNRCDTVVAGVDGGGLRDWLGLVLLGVDRTTGAWLAVGHAWAHERYINEHQEYAARCRTFEKRGELTIVKDVGDPIVGETTSSIDLDQMVDILCYCNELGKFPKVKAVGLDGVAGVDYESRILREIEVDKYGPTLQQIGKPGQGAWLHDAIIGLPRRMQKGQFGHSGSLAMAWCVANAQILRKATGRYHVSREKKAGRDQRQQN